MALLDRYLDSCFSPRATLETRSDWCGQFGRQALQLFTRNGAIFYWWFSRVPPSTHLSQVWDHITKRVKWADTGVEMKVGGGRFSHERENLSPLLARLCRGILRPPAQR